MWLDEPVFDAAERYQLQALRGTDGAPRIATLQRLELHL